MVESYTTYNLANRLGQVQTNPRNPAGYLRQLVEQTKSLARLYPQLSDAHRAFAEAHKNVSFGEITDAGWAEVQRTAAVLADTVRSLGDIEVRLCQKKTRWGTCGEPLNPDTNACFFADRPDWHVP